MASAVSSLKPQQLLCRLRCTGTALSYRPLCTHRRVGISYKYANLNSNRSDRSNHRSFGIKYNHISSFCSQTKEQREEERKDSNDEIETNSPSDATDHDQEEHDDDEYEYDYEYEDDEDSEEDDGDHLEQKEDDGIDPASEYEYEYESDDEFAEDQSDDVVEDDDEISSREIGDSLHSETVSDALPTTATTTSHDEISENFDAESMLNALWVNLPENGRIEGKPVENFISPLILKPLELLEDDIHNKFSLMHQDMDNLWKEAYKIPMENESDLRNIISLAFHKMNEYCDYIEHHFGLRHSPKHYLMRQIRVDHGTIVFLATRKLLYFKYPEWVQSDNWAREEMSENNRRKFLISHELGIGLEHLENESVEGIENAEEGPHQIESSESSATNETNDSTNSHDDDVKTD